MLRERARCSAAKKEPASMSDFRCRVFDRIWFEAYMIRGLKIAPNLSRSSCTIRILFVWAVQYGLIGTEGSDDRETETVSRSKIRSLNRTPGRRLRVGPFESLTKYLHSWLTNLALLVLDLGMIYRALHTSIGCSVRSV